MKIGFFSRITISLACMLLLAFEYSNCQDLSDSLIISGNKKIESENFEGAKTDFEEVLMLAPGNNKALNGKITVLYLEGNTREAGKEIDRALSLDPGYADFYFSRGMLANLKRNYRRAMEDFNRAISLQPSCLSTVYLNLGITRLNMQDDWKALDDFTMAVNHNSQNTSALNYRGMINYRNNQFEAAITDFDTIISLDQGNDIAHYNRAMSYLRSGNASRACIDFHTACKLGNRTACQMIIIECQ